MVFRRFPKVSFTTHHNQTSVHCLCLYFSIDKVSKVTSPVLVIHGTEDEVIDFSHGLAIFERCPKAVEPLWVEVSYSFFHYLLDHSSLFTTIMPAQQFLCVSV